MTPSPLSPDGWLLDLFGSKAARSGAVIRRARRDVECYLGMDRFLAEMDRRGYLAVENGDQIVIFCNQLPIRRLNKRPFSLKENGPETLKVSGPPPVQTDAR
jgi:hypothetical protein